MDSGYRKRAGLMASVGLAIPVVTTLTYMLALSALSTDAYYNERWSDVVSVWLTEVIGFAIGMIAALGLASQPGSEKATWNAVACGGLFGIVSTAIGIGLFKGFGTAGDQFDDLTNAIVNLSFFFYFLSKSLIGAGIAGVGVELLRRGAFFGKAVGLLAGLTGLAAVVVNVAAMATGTELVMPGGVTGTLAGATGAVAVLVVTRLPRSVIDKKDGTGTSV
ncbi:MAG: hypothetical protein AAF511_04200 [Pseudomonadota bacterium]